MLDVSSFPAYIRSLNLTEPVTTRPKPVVSGPPTTLVDLVLWLGLGAWIFDTPKNRALIASMGLDETTLPIVTKRLRNRSQWFDVWQGLARDKVEEAERCAARDERAAARAAIRSALLMLSIGMSGDGLYFYGTMETRQTTYALRRRLHALDCRLSEAHTERVYLRSTLGHTWGVLHFPPNHEPGSEKVPALVCLHPLASDKETFDYALRHYREAGYATLCVDLPAHGELQLGPRLRADSEWVGLLALEALADHVDIDVDRIGVLGGSLGAFYALRVAALSPLVKACIAFATPFDLGALGPAMVPGIVHNFSTITGAATPKDLARLGHDFHLRDATPGIHCPVALVHGTRDSVCDFTSTYAIALRLNSPVSVIPIPGADHEVSYPDLEHVSGPAIAWLRENL